MFITFEGIDGTGKSTQAELLAEYFKKLNREVILVREPGGTELAESIRKLLLNSDLRLNPETELLLFNAARADLVEKIILPAINRSIIVISDRFYDSTTAYQGYGRELSIYEVRQCNITATKGLKPDLTFYLKISQKTAKNRTIEKKPDRIEQSDREFFLRVANGFDIIASQETERIITINAEMGISEIHALIVEKIKGFERSHTTIPDK